MLTSQAGFIYSKSRLLTLPGDTCTVIIIDVRPFGFSTLFWVMLLFNQFQTWHMHSSSDPTDQVRISSKSGQNWVIYGQNKVKLRFCIFCSRPLIFHNMKFFIYYLMGFYESITVYFRQIFNFHSCYVEQIHLPRGVSSDRWAFRLALFYTVTVF